MFDDIQQPSASVFSLGARQEMQSYVDLISAALADLPQYEALDADGRKLLLINLLGELQREALAAPAPDCTVARVGGQRV